MTTTEPIPNTSARLSQIKVVSRAAKYLVIGFLIFTSWFLFQMAGRMVAGFLGNPGIVAQEASRTDTVQICRSLASLGFQIVLCIWYWKLSRLFRFYERGLIFTADVIRCVKVLGILFVTGGIFSSVLHVLPKPPALVLPPGATITVTHVFQMGFFHFDFGTGIDFGLLLAGATIILIAWVMDEGRKIREEQELTV